MQTIIIIIIMIFPGQLKKIDIFWAICRVSTLQKKELYRQLSQFFNMVNLGLGFY